MRFACRFLPATVLLLSALAVPPRLQAQGSLEPPGPPGPTMYSLSQIHDLGAAVSNLLFEVHTPVLAGLRTDVGQIADVLSGLDFSLFMASISNIVALLDALGDPGAIHGEILALRGDVAALDAKVETLGLNVQAAFEGVGTKLLDMEAVVQSNRETLLAISNMIHELTGEAHAP